MFDRSWMVALSNNKQRYLQPPISKNTYHLAIDELLTLVQDYKSRKGISIDIHAYTLNALTTNTSQVFRQGVIDDILQIQSRLGPHEYAGYICGDYQVTPHTEGFIVGKTILIKVASWPISNPLTVHLKHFFKHQYAELNLRVFSQKEIHPQGHEGVACSTINLCYLKNYLKNNGEQLRDYTLNIPYYEKEAVHYFFIPSPMVLKYSQSGCFNRYLVFMVSAVYPGTFEHRDTLFHYPSIQSILEQTLSNAMFLENKEVAQQAQDLLGQLPVFRANWLAAYEKCKETRQKMENKSGANLYLAYQSQKLKRRALSLNISQHNPALVAVITTYKTMKEQKASEQDIVTYLTRIAASMRFSHLHEWGYVLWNLESYQHLFFHHACFVLKSVDDFYHEDTGIAIWLAFEQRQALLEAIRHSSSQRPLFLANAEQMVDLFKWLEFLNIEKNATARLQCIHQHIPDQIKSILMATLENNTLPGMGDYQKERTLITSLLMQWIPNEELIDLLPTLFMRHRLPNVAFFMDDMQTVQFIQQHLSAECIQGILNNAQHTVHLAPEKLQKGYVDNTKMLTLEHIKGMLASYMASFDPITRSSLLFGVIGEAILIQWIEQNLHLGLLMVNLYASYEDAERFIQTHHSLFQNIPEGVLRQYPKLSTLVRAVNEEGGKIIDRSLA